MNHYEKKNLPSPHTGKGQHQHYLPSEGLQAAIDVALELNMPLLLTGESGTGKTMFAYHVAEHFDLGDIIRFNAKTTSSAADLFYFYDALRHFHLIHNVAKKDENLDLVDAEVIRFQALGEAIRRANKDNKRSVVLIDEIDKTPRDFPNDLLHALEGAEISFKVPELQEEFKVEAKLKPVIILTSNSEKSLPEPFLRRCVFFHIPFPSPDMLLAIVSGKLEARGRTDAFTEDELKALIDEFMAVRDLLKKRNVKLPATAELISWLVIMDKLGLKHKDLAQLTDEQKQAFSSSLSILGKSTEALAILRKHYALTTNG